MTIHQLATDLTLFHGDCRAVLRILPDNFIDSCVTDPPYALVSTMKRFGSPNAAPAKGNDAYMRASAGFMGKTWDTGECAMDPTFWADVFRVLKPGAHLAAFGATRGYHRMACAIEDAGFEIRDSLMWLYGTGFPKSQPIARFIDRELGLVGATVATGDAVKRMIPGADQNKDGWIKDDGREFIPHEYLPASPQAQEFDGFGTALKPANEPIVLARKPLSEDTIAANVLRWRTGALNINGCRVGTESTARRNHAEMGYHGGNISTNYATGSESGRWPANLCHDGSNEVLEAFPNTAARFFFSAKANRADRAGSKHPTVKPVALMQWLARLITPLGGLVLDPFAGSGTTGAAAVQEAFRCILIEREAEYVQDICNRFAAPSIVPY